MAPIERIRSRSPSTSRISRLRRRRRWREDEMQIGQLFPDADLGPGEERLLSDRKLPRDGWGPIDGISHDSRPRRRPGRRVPARIEARERRHDSAAEEPSKRAHTAAPARDTRLDRARRLARSFFEPRRDEERLEGFLPVGDSRRAVSKNPPTRIYEHTMTSRPKPSADRPARAERRIHGGVSPRRRPTGPIVAIGGALAMFGLAAGCGGSSSQGLVYHVVERADLDIVVTERGDLQCQDVEKVICEVDDIEGDGVRGTPIKWVIDNGSTVEAGDLLVELTDDSHLERLDRQILLEDRAETDQIQAQTNYDNQKTQNETTLAEAKLQVELAEARPRTVRRRRRRNVPDQQAKHRARDPGGAGESAHRGRQPERRGATLPARLPFERRARPGPAERPANEPPARVRRFPHEGARRLRAQETTTRARGCGRLGGAKSFASRERQRRGAHESEGGPRQRQRRAQEGTGATESLPRAADELQDLRAAGGHGGVRRE